MRVLEEEEEEVCPDAGKNPTCPYLTAIHTNTAQVSRSEKALVGEDMQSGLVAKVHQLRSRRKFWLP